MSLATLTKVGRAAIAAAMAAQPLHLAWGVGDPAWEDPEANLPSLINATALTGEIGRRAVGVVGFVTPDDQGDIVIPVGRGADDTVQEARYRQVSDATPYLYLRAQFDYGDASNAIIREMAVFMGTVTDLDLPPGQRYFTPDQLTNPGRMLAAQIILPSINRSPSVRQSIEFVIPI